MEGREIPRSGALHQRGRKERSNGTVIQPPATKRYLRRFESCSFHSKITYWIMGSLTDLIFRVLFSPRILFQFSELQKKSGMDRKKTSNMPPCALLPNDGMLWRADGRSPSFGFRTRTDAQSRTGGQTAGARSPRSPSVHRSPRPSVAIATQPTPILSS